MLKALRSDPHAKRSGKHVLNSAEDLLVVPPKRRRTTSESDCTDLTYKNTIRSDDTDEFGQGSDQNTAIITAGNAGKEHTSCDSDAKGGDKKFTEGSTHQSSLDLFTVVPRKVEMQPK
jgi:hypothetical protein